MYKDDTSIRMVTTVLQLGKLMSSNVLILKYASQISWEVVELIGRSSGHWRHVLGCTVCHSLVFVLSPLFAGVAGSFIMNPFLFTDPPQKKDLQIALVFLNCDKSMTSGNLRKEKNCLAFTSRSWSTSVRFQGRNLKQKSWREGATCRLALCLLTGSCLVSFFMIPRTNFSGNSAIHSGLGHHTSIPYSPPICWPDLSNSIEDFSSQKKLDCVN